MNAENCDFDVAIIGASLAGASAACSLSRGNARIVLIDKEIFPRKKPCGEGLTPAGYEALRSLGLRFESVPHIGYRVWNERNSAVFRVKGVARGSPLGFGVRREHLDSALVNLAGESANVTCLFETKISELKIDDAAATLKVKGGELSAKRLIIADGASSLCAARLGIPSKRSTRRTYAMSMSCHSQNHSDFMELLIRRGYETYITPVGEATANLSVLGTKDEVRELLDPASLRVEIDRIFQTTGIELRITGEVLAAGPIAPISRVPVYGHAFLAGDACESLDPLSGMGMTFAILSGISAGAQLRRYLAKEISWETARASYCHEVSLLSRKMRGYTRTATALVRELRSTSVLQTAQNVGLAQVLRNAAVSPRDGFFENILMRLGR